MESSLNEWIEEMMDVLDIDHIDIEFIDNLPTETMMAAYVPSEEIIYIKKGIKSFLDIVLVITHELRHVYQHRNGLIISHKKREFKDTKEYNDQELEVDAYAFALLMIERYLGVVPDLPILNTEAILKRKKELKKIYIPFNH